MLGLNPEDMIGQSVKETMSHIPQLINLLTPPLANQQPLIHRDMIIKHWDGSQITVTATATPMYDADNHLSGVVGLIEDVTELKTLEAERRRLDRLAYLGEMSAVVAHELRNPIAGIAAGTNYLIRKFPSDSPNYEAGQMILKEVDRVQRITEDILLIARPLNLQKAPHSLKDIIAAVCKKYQSALPEKGIELNITLAETLPELSIDRAKIEQVISNLMENAIQAMPDGGTISITADHVPADSKIIILFKDTGSGISIAGTQKIFEPFFTTKSRGTGLGLTLSRRILEAHQGAINIVTIDESGTTFEIGLPIQ
jgi:PAS domain S-box-containing protein